MNDYQVRAIIAAIIMQHDSTLGGILDGLKAQGIDPNQNENLVRATALFMANQLLEQSKNEQAH